MYSSILLEAPDLRVDLELQGGSRMIYEYIPCWCLKNFREESRSFKDNSWVYSLVNVSLKSSRKVDQELQEWYMSVFLINRFSKASGSRPGASRRMWVYSLLNVLEKLEEIKPGPSGGYMSVFIHYQRVLEIPITSCDLDMRKKNTSYGKPMNSYVKYLRNSGLPKRHRY